MNVTDAIVARTRESTGHELMNPVHPLSAMSGAMTEATAMAYGEATDI